MAKHIKIKKGDSIGELVHRIEMELYRRAAFIDEITGEIKEPEDNFLTEATENIEVIIKKWR